MTLAQHTALSNNRDRYAKFPRDISHRTVLLLDPVLASGVTLSCAIECLLSHGVPEEHIMCLSLLASPQGVKHVCRRFTKIKVLTTEIDETLDETGRILPGIGFFGDRYFGTEGPEEDKCAHTSRHTPTPPTFTRHQTRQH